jgi:hypothetical protein
VTRTDRRHLLQRLAFSESRHLGWDKDPTNTIAYDSYATINNINGRWDATMAHLAASAPHGRTAQRERAAEAEGATSDERVRQKARQGQSERGGGRGDNGGGGRTT